MRTLLRLAVFSGAAALLGGCGMIYTNIHSPYSYRAATPSEVKSAPGDEIVTGEACNQSVLYLVAWGNGGYIAATKKAVEGKPDGILYDVKTDVKVTAILLGLYTKVCTRVTGRVTHS